MDNRQSGSKMVQQDLLDIFLDKDNRDPVVLTDDEGKKITFEQVAVIPFEVEGIVKLYVILKPVDQLAGVAPDEAIVFLVDESVNGNCLKVEANEDIAVGVFNEYYKLLDEADSESYDSGALSRFIELLDKKRKGGKL